MTTYLNPHMVTPKDFLKSSKKWHSFRLKGKAPIDLAEIIYRMIQLKVETVYKTINKVQCSSNRSRSIEDVYRVAKFYKPEISLEAVKKAVMSLYGKRINYSFCNTVKRYVHQPWSYSTKVEDYRKSLDKLNIVF